MGGRFFERRAGPYGIADPGKSSRIESWKSIPPKGLRVPWQCSSAEG